MISNSNFSDMILKTQREQFGEFYGSMALYLWVYDYGAKIFSF